MTRLSDYLLPDDVDDLVEPAAHRRRRLLGGARRAHFADLARQPRRRSTGIERGSIFPTGQFKFDPWRATAQLTDFLGALTRPTAPVSTVFP